MNSVVHGSPPADAFEDLIRQVASLRAFIVQQAERRKAVLQGLSPKRHRSAENLLHYMALRSKDIRPLQDKLERLGLSSLGRPEAHVLASLDTLLQNLRLLSGKELPQPGQLPVHSVYDTGVNQLQSNAVTLFGKHPRKRQGHIIVTMSAEAADNYLLVHQLVKSGMTCMRINCVHDGPSTWSQMIAHLRLAEQATGQSCRVLMDLAGPKLRLGTMELLPGVMKIRPVRATDGQVVRPARIWLTGTGEAFAEMPTADASLAVDPDWLSGLKSGDCLKFQDNRGSRRSWLIRESTTGGCWVEAKKTAYLTDGTVLQLRRRDGGKGPETTIEGLPPKESFSLVRPGDILFVSLTDEPGKAALHDINDELLTPGRVSLAIPEVFRDVRLGEPISFDDGRISGLVEKCEPALLQIRITHTRNPVEKLEGRRGINLPDTSLKLPALSAKDKEDLEFAVRHSDLVGLSFTNRPADVRTLRGALKTLGREDIGVVLKIETKMGFSNLPAILLEALKLPACGAMIARGDLAVECGFNRLSEVQEEMLWICEAAHVPVILATQVLEGLTKYGHVTRAEITDAAMAQAAEAVMLNKGSHIVEAVEMLNEILQREQKNHRKKHYPMRKMRLASGLKKRKYWAS